MYNYHNPIEEMNEAYDEVDDFCRMSDDLIGAGLEIIEDNENGNYEVIHSIQKSVAFDKNITESRFKEHVRSCRKVVEDDTYNYIKVKSELEFESDFDMIKGTYKIKITGDKL